MIEPFDKQLTFEAAGAAYGAAQQASTNFNRGTIEAVEGLRDGAGTGTVTFQIYEDATMTRLVCEGILELDGDQDVDVAAPATGPRPWRSVGGPYVRIKDSAAHADDITLTIEGTRRHGA